MGNVPSNLLLPPVENPVDSQVTAAAPRNPYIANYNETTLYGVYFRRTRSNPYYNFTFLELRQIAQRYRLSDTSAFSYTPIGLSEVINRCYVLEHPRVSLKVRELQAEARSRGLKLPKSRLKADIILMLEKSDSDPERPFPFLDLPFELRVHVYRYLFLQVHPFRHDQASKTLYSYSSAGSSVYPVRSDRSSTSPYGRGQAPDLAEPAVTRVSRQVRDESLPVFYQTRRFPLFHVLFSRQFSNPPTLFNGMENLAIYTWVPHLSKDKVANLRAFNIVVMVGTRRPYETFLYLDIDLTRNNQKFPNGKKYELSWWTCLYGSEVPHKKLVELGLLNALPARDGEGEQLFGNQNVPEVPILQDFIECLEQICDDVCGHSSSSSSAAPSDSRSVHMDDVVELIRLAENLDIR